MAQIIPTTNWGAENSRLNTSGIINGQPALIIEGGASRRSNLFHSFQQFNIGAGQRVYFNNPAGIQTIFSRTIGNQSSNIAGTLGVNGTANLFLLNPQGIIFGPMAQLDVRGSFMATTANSIQFGNQGEFTSTSSPTPPLLTVAPSALNFVANQGAIIHQSPNITGAPGQSLTLLGASVRLDGGNLTVPGGKVILSGINGDGVLGLQQVGNQFQIMSLQGTPADITLNNSAQLNVRSDGGGDVLIRANNFTMHDSIISAGVVANTMTIPGGRSGRSETPPDSRARSPRQDSGPSNRQEPIGSLAQSVTLPNPIGDTAAPPSQGGAIVIDAQGDVLLDDRALINNSILLNAQGSTGKTEINAQNITLSNISRIITELQGKGNLGEVSLKSENDTIFITAPVTGLPAKNRPLENPDFFKSGILRKIDVEGNGNIGKTTLRSRNLSLLGDASLSIQSLGQGKIDDVRIQAGNAIDLNSVRGLNAPTGEISVAVESSAQSDLGNLNIFAQALNLDQDAMIQSKNDGSGRVGDINIELMGRLSLNRLSSIQTGTFSFTSQSGSGKISITANDISIMNGASISSSKILGSGISGDLTLLARDTFILDGTSSGSPSTIASLFVGSNGLPGGLQFESPAARGAGNIRLQAKTLSILNGALISSDIFNTDGTAGQIAVETEEQVRILGLGLGFDPRLVFTGRAQSATSRTPLRARISASTVGVTSSSGGNIQITTPRLIVEQDGIIDAVTLSQGAGGNIQINSSQVDLKSGGQIQTSAFDQGNAGTVSINSQERIRVVGKSTNRKPTSADIPNSAILASTSPMASGKGGSIQLATEQLIVEDRGRISVSSQGKDIAGQLAIKAASVKLQDDGRLLAETRSNAGGNILLNLSQVLLLRRNSGISTTAGTAQLGGNGGSINIQVPFIVSVPGENSDIAANAFSGAGGQVNINALNLFGIQSRTRLELEQRLQVSDPSQLNPSRLTSNDITAISQTSPTLSGSVSISQLDVDPTQAAARLPDDLLDRANLINQSLCRITRGSQFVLTGRGGLPTVPTRPLTPLKTWEDIRLGDNSISNRTTVTDSTASQQPHVKTIVEAQGFRRNANGQVYLTAMANQAKSTWSKSSDCSSASTASP
ncbi:filamentous hemagglutinin N-terminal domain-containing protein [filamentous cyanobacterium LEGE 11480]|uniref:Filamentous hemagglutinin N-terminal domain-containing protein n=1 Tax=Romeriopsis navalis LEGE 11480 TaxID=2777977 RepID=A0A928Z295_9CYAN|nr:filamentous hemagglutinin N-terminal domain-containing protein [Romeriopsis navalis]MBE9029314.1 filamentous hemagglutinin N-terminal domain-containing protein [Romeriopsis navalis LEGE 11480]